MKNLVLSGFFLLINFLAAGQKVDVSIAKQIGQIVFEREKPDRKNMKIKEIIPLGNINDTLIYIVPFPDDGFAIISADYRNSPILGYCKQGSYSPGIMPPALNYLIDSYKASIAIKKKNGKLPDEKLNKKWESTLSISASNNLIYSPLNTTVVEPLTHTSWGQQSSFNQYCPSTYPAGCTAVAMAQILCYWNCRINPIGIIEYSGIGWQGGYANIGATTYDWFAMDNNNADNENSRLIYHAGVSCLTHYESNGSSSTPGRARDGFVNNWGINSDADVKWRISHLSNWQTMLQDELDLGRPILYSGGALLGGGHSWVIDGYNSDGYFHCNWGYYGAYNDAYYSLGDFDPGDNGPFNQYESAIFNVEPIQSAGVAMPQLMPQTFTYSPSGYTLTIPSAFGASSYEWATDKGTISGTGTTVTLSSNCSANVRVRAFNNICDIFSPYKTVLISINYGPITGSTLICSSGSTFTVNNLPYGSTVSWTCSSNISFDNQTGNPKTFTAIGTNLGWVLATANIPNCGTLTLPVKTVWLGKPQITVSNISNLQDMGYSNYYKILPATDNYAYEGTLTVAVLQIAGVIDYSWSFYSNIPKKNIAYWSTSENTVDAGAKTSNAGEVLKYTTYNTCGESYNLFTFFTGDMGTPPPPPLVITPNPATTQTEVSFDGAVIEANDITELSSPSNNNTYIVSLMNSSGVCLYSASSSGKKFTIPTSSLKNGTYIVRLTDGRNVQQGNLVVNH